MKTCFKSLVRSVKHETPLFREEFLTSAAGKIRNWRAGPQAVLVCRGTRLNFDFGSIYDGGCALPVVNVCAVLSLISSSFE